MWTRVLTCLSLQNFIIIGQTVVEIWQFIVFFQGSDRPPTWICGAHFRSGLPMHKEHLGVGLYTTVQNLVGIALVFGMPNFMLIDVPLSWSLLQQCKHGRATL